MVDKIRAFAQLISLGSQAQNGLKRDEELERSDIFTFFDTIKNEQAVREEANSSRMIETSEWTSRVGDGEAGKEFWC